MTARTARRPATGVVAWAASLVGLLSGCGSLPAAGPAPAVALPDRFAAQPAAASPAMPQASLVGPWWETFGDAGLARAVEQVLAQNLDLEQARLRVEQSRALADRARSQGLPRADLGATASASRLSTAADAEGRLALDRTPRSVGADVTVAWEPDFFGRARATVTAASARTDAAEAEAAALALSLSAETARRVLELRSLQAQRRLDEEALRIEQELVDVVEARQRAGLATQADVLRALAQRQGTHARRDRLEAATGDALQAMAVLLATTPAQAAQVAGAAALPAPGGLQSFARTPAQVLARRPDVAAAQARLRAASADLAATAAERFPQVNLLASVGVTAAALSSLGTSGALRATLAPSLTWRAFDFGAREADLAGRQAGERAAAAAYRQAVLAAFAEAETALSRVAARQVELAAAEQAARMQTEVASLARLRYERGVADLAEALEAQRLVNSLERERVGSQHALAVAVVEGYRATAAGVVGTDSR